MTRTRLTRRNLLIAGSAVLATPYLSSRPARAAGQVVIRNPGGAWSDTQKKFIYEPFTTETGIEVVIVPTTLTKMLAMVKSGNNELDVADAGYDGLVELDKAKALAPIDYAGWKYAKPDDIPEEYKTANTAGMALYATVLGYNTSTFPNNSEPKGWAEFWDAKKFPGARMLQDMAAGTPNLEFALIADGVPMDRVNPIDIDRAFKSMSRIKPYIKKFWDTGALSAQMLADRDVVLGSIWNGRLQAIAEKGRAGGNRLDPAYAVNPGLRHLQGREKPEKRAALRRLRDAGGGAGRDAEGVELRSDKHQGVRYADCGPEGEPAGQPGEHEAVLHPGRQLVER